MYRALRKTSRLVKWILHPISIFVVLQAVLITVVILWVHWFYDRSEQLQELAETVGRPYVEGIEYVTLVVGCSLLAIILGGTIFQFVIFVKQKILNKQQHSF